MISRNKSNLLCRIWAWEEDTSTLESHHCHANFYRLSGGLHLKAEIDRVLTETPVEIRRMRWTLKACEPEHDGKECERCKYSPYRGLSYMYNS